jgi:hypothetical protein
MASSTCSRGPGALRRRTFEDLLDERLKLPLLPHRAGAQPLENAPRQRAAPGDRGDFAIASVCASRDGAPVSPRWDGPKSTRRSMRAGGEFSGLNLRPSDEPLAADPLGDVANQARIRREVIMDTFKYTGPLRAAALPGTDTRRCPDRKGDQVSSVGRVAAAGMMIEEEVQRATCETVFAFVKSLP